MLLFALLAEAVTVPGALVALARMRGAVAAWYDVALLVMGGVVVVAFAFVCRPLYNDE